MIECVLVVSLSVCQTTQRMYRRGHKLTNVFVYRRKRRSPWRKATRSTAAPPGEWRRTPCPVPIHPAVALRWMTSPARGHTRPSASVEAVPLNRGQWRRLATSCRVPPDDVPACSAAVTSTSKGAGRSRTSSRVLAMRRFDGRPTDVVVGGMTTWTRRTPSRKHVTSDVPQRGGATSSRRNSRQMTGWRQTTPRRLVGVSGGGRCGVWELARAPRGCRRPGRSLPPLSGCWPVRWPASLACSDRRPLSARQSRAAETCFSRDCTRVALLTRQTAPRAINSCRRRCETRRRRDGRSWSGRRRVSSTACFLCPPGCGAGCGADWPPTRRTGRRRPLADCVPSTARWCGGYRASSMVRAATRHSVSRPSQTTMTPARRRTTTTRVATATGHVTTRHGSQRSASAVRDKSRRPAADIINVARWCIDPAKNDARSVAGIAHVTSWARCQDTVWVGRLAAPPCDHLWTRRG